MMTTTDSSTGRIRYPEIKPATNRNVYDIKGRITSNDQVRTMKYENIPKIYKPTGMTLNAAGVQNYNGDLIQSIVYNENNDPVSLDVPNCSLLPSKPIRHHKATIKELHEKLFLLKGGRGASQIVGLTDLSLMKLIAEVGTDMNAWKTEKHFTSWSGLTPNIHQSGKNRKSKQRRAKNLVGQNFERQRRQ